MSTKHRVLLYLLVAPFIFSDRNLRLGGKFVLEDFGNCCNSQENCNKFDLSTAFGKKIWGQRGLRSLPSQNFIPDLQKLAERIALRSNESFFFKCFMGQWISLMETWRSDTLSTGCQTYGSQAKTGTLRQSNTSCPWCFYKWVFINYEYKSNIHTYLATLLLCIPGKNLSSTHLYLIAVIRTGSIFTFFFFFSGKLNRKCLHRLFHMIIFCLIKTLN